MKEYLERSLNRQNYETPKMEVIVLETYGIMCSSAGDGTRGGTESLNLTNVNWP